MTASSSTVLANLAYLIGAVVFAVIIGLLVWLRHRQPKSVDANMASFRRGLSALAPDDPARATQAADEPRVRPLPGPGGRGHTGGHRSYMTHVRLEPAHRGAGGAGVAEDTGDDTEGGQAG